MRCTSGWRTTSWASKKVKATPSTPRSTPMHVTAGPTACPRQVGLRHIARDHGFGAEADAREEHLHLLDGGVLRLIEDDEGIVERAAAHEGERRHLDHVALDEARHAVESQHLVERVVHRAQVRIDLLREVARQEPQPLAGLHRRPHQDDAPHASPPAAPPPRRPPQDRSCRSRPGRCRTSGRGCGCARGTRADDGRGRGCRRAARGCRAPRRVDGPAGASAATRARAAPDAPARGVTSSSLASANSSCSMSSALAARAPQHAEVVAAAADLHVQARLEQPQVLIERAAEVGQARVVRRLEIELAQRLGSGYCHRRPRRLCGMASVTATSANRLDERSRDRRS